MTHGSSSCIPSSVMGSASKRRGADEDRISSLPDPILCHILSYLDTVDAVRSSILSSRWRHTWISVANLKFVDSLCPYSISEKARLARMQSFVNFVNRVLMLRNHPCINRFSLRLFNEYSNSDVDSWIWAAITHNVEELDLYISRSKIQIPQIIFTSESLKVLKLNYSGIEVKIPNSVCMPSLKVLHLEFRKQYLGDISLERLLSSSKNLEELMIISHFNMNLQNICVQSTSLKTLKLDLTPGIRGFGLGLVIDTPNLEFLQLIYRQLLGHRFDLEVKHLWSVVKAIVDLEYYKMAPGAFGGKLVHLLKQMCNVKDLFLSSGLLNVIFYGSSRALPHFYNLNQLALTICLKEWSNLPDILRISPNLKVLLLDKKSCHTISYEGFNEEQSVAQCLTSSLERFEFTGFCGEAEDMEMLEYILRNAKILKKVRISTQFRTKKSEQELLKKLSLFPGTCQFIIEHGGIDTEPYDEENL